MPSIKRSLYLLNTPTAMLFFSIIERSVLIALVFYFKDNVRTGNGAKKPTILSFCFLPKEPSAVARKIETDCIFRNLQISINLAKK